MVVHLRPPKTSLPRLRPPKELLFILPMIIALGILPLIGAVSFVARILFWAILFVIMSISWNIVGGFAGQISFGHAAFYGVGGYALALLAYLYKIPWLLALPLAGIFAAGLSIIVGFPTLRLRGPFFAIATLSLGEIMRIIANNVDEVFIGGSSGLGIPIPEGWTVFHSYWLALGVVLVASMTAYYMKNSKLGLRLLAIKDDEDAAETSGVDTFKSKLIALMLSAFIMGIAGAVEVTYSAYVYPDHVFKLKLSVQMVLMVLLGGIGTFWGPILGGTLFMLLDQVLLVTFPHFHLMIYGSAIIAILLFEPNGLVGIAERVAKRLR